MFLSTSCFRRSTIGKEDLECLSLFNIRRSPVCIIISIVATADFEPRDQTSCETPRPLGLLHVCAGGGHVAVRRATDRSPLDKVPRLFGRGYAASSRTPERFGRGCCVAAINLETSNTRYEEFYDLLCLSPLA
jgi:hypothetical protein